MLRRRRSQETQHPGDVKCEVWDCAIGVVTCVGENLPNAFSQGPYAHIETHIY
jgi:hypothetical protein